MVKLGVISIYSLVTLISRIVKIDFTKNIENTFFKSIEKIIFKYLVVLIVYILENKSINSCRIKLLKSFYFSLILILSNRIFLLLEYKITL